MMVFHLEKGTGQTACGSPTGEIPISIQEMHVMTRDPDQVTCPVCQHLTADGKARFTADPSAPRLPRNTAKYLSLARGREIEAERAALRRTVAVGGAALHLSFWAVVLHGWLGAALVAFIWALAWGVSWALQRWLFRSK